MEEEELESIERTVQEIDALSIIYDNDDNDGFQSDFGSPSCQTRFSILSTSAYQEMKEASLKGHTQSCPPKDGLKLSTQLILEVQLDVMTTVKPQPIKAILQFKLPSGYPINSPAVVCIVSVDTLSRSQREDMALEMNEKAKQMIGSEVLMDLIQDFNCNIMDQISSAATLNKKIIDVDQELKNKNDVPSVATISRRWIWVHHITNNNRIKDIVEEANNFSLGGYLKSGYPGVVIIEGTTHSCDEFVTWVKGNKSRPGGFGRNWGHHVRGQIENCEEMKFTASTSDTNIQDGNKFVHVGDDLKLLAALCKEVDVEDEFLMYIMQHSH